MNRREFLQQLTDPIREEITSPTQPAYTELSYISVPTAGSPRQYPRGARVLVEDVQVWLCRDDGGFYAIDAHCPHLGCLVRPIEGGFVCPCHKSRFDAAGERKSGSAPRSLRCLYVDVDTDGHLIISRDRTVDPRERFMA